MTARNYAEATVAQIDIAEVKLAIDQTAAYTSVVIGVKARTIEVDLAFAAQIESFGAPGGGEYVG